MNKKLVSYVTMISRYTITHQFESESQEFEFYYKLTKKLISSPQYESNVTFCVRKLLSLLDYVLNNDSTFICYYAHNQHEKMDLNCIQYLNSDTNLLKVAVFILLINYKLDPVIIKVLQEFQGFQIISRVLVDNYQREKCQQLNSQHAIYKNCMELLYEFCKDVKLSSNELNEIDPKFTTFLLESIRGLTKAEDEYNFYKFKIVVILNEQYMVQFYETQGDQQSEPCENKIFTTLLQNDEMFRNFCDCLILNFNRESDDHVMQILILKILYLIFTTSMTCQKFYLNDLRVLIDIFNRELSNLSIFDNQILLINTYLRVLYPMLLFSQLKDEKYKTRLLIEICQSLLRELEDEDSYKTLNEENLAEIPTTKRLTLRVLKLLSYESLRTDSVSSEISNHSAVNINRLNSSSLNNEFDRSRSSSVASSLSYSSNGHKKPPPIPLPRKNSNQIRTDPDLSFSSPTVPKR